MTELTKFNGTVEALYNITDVELIDLPKLRSLFFMSGLNNVEKVIMVNAGKAEEEQTLKRVWEEGKKKEEEQRIKEWKIREREILRKNIQDFFNKKNKGIAYKRVGLIVVHDDCCNVKEMTQLDLTAFVNLRELRVGDRCFKYVKIVTLREMKYLMKVEVGANSFTVHRNSHHKDLSCTFSLKNCPLMKELKVGCYSFSDYRECEISAVPSLEVIEMGKLNERSYCFYDASLVLKGKGSEGE